MKLFPQLARGTVANVSPGVYPAMPREQYDAIPAFNQSTLKKWIELRSIPSEFKWWLDHRHEQEISDALLIGKAVDTLLLGKNDDFNAEFVELPSDAPKRPTATQWGAKKPSPETVDAIAYWSQFERHRKGRLMIKSEMLQKAQLMAEKMKTDPDIIGLDLFNHCQKTVLVAEVHGFPVKCEVDLWSEKTTHIFDLKTCRDVTRDGFAKAVVDHGYDKQAAFYLMIANAIGFEKNVFDFFCILNEEPHTFAIHSISPLDVVTHRDIIEASQLQLIDALKELAGHLESDSWPSPRGFQPINFPFYHERNCRDYLA